jgi:TonB family protein
MAESSDLESRIRALLDRNRRRGPVSARSVAGVAAAALAVFLPVATVTAPAQGPRGALAGTVEDASGARIPNCEVIATNLDSSNEEVARANPAGEFVFTAIPPGRYSVKFRAPGFAVKTVDAAVTSGVASRVDARLELGKISEHITVTGRRPATAKPLSPMQTPQRIRVGGNVQQSKLISHVRPDYPEELRRLGIQGTVVLRAVISKQGDLLNLAAVNTDVHPRLATAALEAVRQWRYQPTLLNGEPVEVLTTITIDFSLE